MSAATGAGVAVVETYTGAAYTAGAGVVYSAATFSGTCTQHRVHHAVLSDLERELLVVPHGTEPALSSPLRGARAAFDLHG